MGVEATDQVAYDAAYQAEMDRLNAEAAKATTPGAGQTEVPPKDKTDEQKGNSEAPNAAPKPEDKVAQLEARLASTEKALNDTKKWAQQARADAKRLAQEREAEKRQANRPAVLADNPGLEEAIQYVAGTPAQQNAPKGGTAASVDEWADAVGTALPDLDALLEKNPELKAKAQAIAQELGEEWMNPLVAIRELGKLQVEHVRAGIAATAQEQARKDFERSKQKQTAMHVPSGSSGSRQPANPTDDPKRYETMSSADFAKERAKVLGYN